MILEIMNKVQYWHPLNLKTFKTGVFVQMPEGIEAQVRGRSGLWFKHSITIGQTGTIDSGYTGEISVKLINLSNEFVRIEKDERIAQIIFAKYENPEFISVEKLDESDRGNNGFGHTGKK